jgi:predicted O-methyltransferase YrrM
VSPLKISKSAARAAGKLAACGTGAVCYDLRPMENLTRRPTTDPEAILHERDGIYAPELVAAAIVDLDFFTWLAKTPTDVAGICAAFGFAERPVDAMMTLFCAHGYVEKKGPTFHLCKTAQEFLVRDSPWFVGPYFTHFRGRPIYEGLLETLRTDKPGGWAGAPTRKPWAQSMEDDQFAQEFTGTMDARGTLVGPVLASTLDLRARRHLLDVAGGSGIYACCMAAAHPDLRATVFERPPVDRVTRKSIARRGYTERVDVLSGDMFRDELPRGCDVHLWSNALHDWDAPLCRQLLAKSFAALPPDGLVVVHDKHLNRAKTGPLRIAEHSVFLMAATEGRYYSVAEVEEFLLGAGFVDVGFRDVILDFSIVTARKP